jgi:hypothetical protein
VVGFLRPKDFRRNAGVLQYGAKAPRLRGGVRMIGDVKGKEKEEVSVPSLFNSCSFPLHCGGCGVWARNNFGWNWPNK